MNSFYDLTKKIKDTLKAEPFVNTVTYGSLDDIDLNKQTIFPLSHIIVNNAVVGENTVAYNISVLSMDIVDESKEEVTDNFVGNNNEQDVLNTQLEVQNRLIALLQRGDLYRDKYQVEGDVTCEPFVDRFENKLAGWAATFDVIVPNDMTIC
tara:strand:- start:339 stop:794 length:456 start_codon:yes stop_codon:yes gene_type:complete